MKKYVDLLLEAVQKHDPQILPLTKAYKSTENLRPSALIMMDCFRTITKVNAIGQIFEDKVLNNVFFYANVSEAGNHTLFYGRLKIHEDKISELDLNLLRSRGQAGFMYNVDEVGNLPSGWTDEIPEGQKASRKELEEVASHIYSGEKSFPYPFALDCYTMENGGVVMEDPDYASSMFSDECDPAADEKKELIKLPGMIPPLTPVLPAKCLLIDEAQGVIGIWATMDGFAAPYISNHEVSSCFVPADIVQVHRETLPKDKMQDYCLMTELPASCITVELFRYYGGAVHGQHRFTQLQGAGARSVWEQI